MAGGVAVAVAGRPRGAGFRQAPVGRKALARPGSPAIWRRAPMPSECPSSPRQECPSAAAARRACRPRRRRGNRRMRRAPTAAPPRSARRWKIPRRQWSVSARSAWRRSVRQWSTSSFMFLQLRRSIRFSSGLLVGLVGERVIDHANEILAGQFASAPISCRDRRTVLPPARRPRSCPP